MEVGADNHSFKDQSFKMLRIAKAKLMKLHGKIPDNLVFLHADAI